MGARGQKAMKKKWFSIYFSGAIIFFCWVIVWVTPLNAYLLAPSWVGIATSIVCLLLVWMPNKWAKKIPLPTVTTNNADVDGTSATLNGNITARDTKS